MTTPERRAPSAPEMSPERWATVRALAEHALDREPQARDAFLREACGGDDELRAVVNRLVRSCERSEAAASFLSAPTASLADAIAESGRVALRAALGDRYEIERELGRGGMAVVHLAHDRRHDRRVAVKVLQPDLRAAVSVERFLREIRVTARLAHPHILPLHDSGASKEVLFYVMPFVDGESLRQRLRREPRPSEDAIVRLLRDVASALDYAHRQGVIHRDIKPENILLQDGHAIVADFGIARALSRARESDDSGRAGAAIVTQPGLSLGTPGYMAPEQVLGDAATDHRADLYALGVVAYEALAGGHPFDARTPQAMVAAHLGEEPRPLPDRAPAVSPTLASLVMRLLAKDPASRPQTAGEVLHALDGAGMSSGERVRPPAAARPRVPAMRRPRLVLPLAAGAIVVAFVAYDASRGTSLSRDRVAGMALVNDANARPSVAVMPFANTGGDAANEFFSDGLTEELIGTLGKIDGLRVVGRTSVYALKGKGLGTRAIADTLGVAHVLEGSVRRTGDRLKVSAQLVAREDAIVWSESYDRDGGDVFALQEEIARSIAAVLGVTSGSDAARPTAGGRPTKSAEAWESYLRGRFILYGRTDRESMNRALAQFARAVALDPQFARAHAGLSDAHSRLGVFGFGPPHAEFAKAKASALRALQLDSLLPDAHAALGHLLFVYDFESAAAERELRRAIQLDPGYFYARVVLAICLQDQERFDEAIAQLDSARATDPLAPQIDNVLGRVYENAGKPDLAIRHLRRALELNPQADLAYQVLGHAYLQKGMHAEAIAALRRAAALSGIRDSAHLAYAYAVSGMRSEGERIVRQLTDRANDRYVPPYHVALAYAGLGDADQAFHWLERGFEERASFMDGVKVTRGFARLHGDARWTSLMQRMGFER